MRRIVAGVVAVGLLSACTTGSAADPTPTLDVLMADDWETAPAVREVVRAFERDHDVRIQVQAAPFSQIPDLVRNASELGDPFDLAHWHAFAAGADGIAEPLDELWDTAGLAADDYLPGAIDDVTWDGQRYGVPLDVNALVLLANRDVLASAGYDADDLRDVHGFVDVARGLRDSEQSEFAITVTASIWSAYGWIRAFGGDVMTRGDDGEPTFTFDDPRTVAAIEALGTLATEDLSPPPFAPDLSIDSIQALTDGAVALHASGSWDLPVMQRARGEVVADDIEVLPMPSGDGDTGTVLGGSSLFVPEGSDEVDLAFEFALALTDPGVGVTLARQEGRLPAVLAAYDDPLFTSEPDLAAFVEQLPRADVMPLIAYPELSAAFGAALERVLKGQQEAVVALGELQELAERIGPS